MLCYGQMLGCCTCEVDEAKEGEGEGLTTWETVVVTAGWWVGGSEGARRGRNGWGLVVGVAPALHFLVAHAWQLR